ncbi:hypothetical protein EVAR_57601_1 [Eumeta japonica]|uniref:Uncharacterized protein n=1 Tax=Eumeta variegata TaxID=151549 RepID=A0A4C1Y1J8_EUMVA|nr:hypothetical protein EVAR_57601_1 [Eumeta japonica]
MTAPRLRMSMGDGASDKGCESANSRQPRLAHPPTGVGMRNMRLYKAANNQAEATNNKIEATNNKVEATNNKIDATNKKVALGAPSGCRIYRIPDISSTNHHQAFNTTIDLPLIGHRIPHRRRRISDIAAIIAAISRTAGAPADSLAD